MNIDKTSAFRTIENTLRYWRNSLADAELCKGALQQGDVTSIGYREVPRSEILQGRLEDPMPFFRPQGRDDDAALQRTFVKVFVHLYVYRQHKNHQHGVSKMRGRPEILSPIGMWAWLQRDGTLWTGARPSIARDVMDPIIIPGGEPLTVASVSAFDDFIDRTPFGGRDNFPATEGFEPGIFSWQQALQYAGQLHETLAIPAELYTLSDGCLALTSDSAGGASSKKIIEVYDDILQAPRPLRLLNGLVAGNLTPPALCDVSPPVETMFLRLGSADPKFPLARAQRDAVSHCLMFDAGEVLAVNGPPGTGKTTMLQNLLACLFVDGALNQTEPPVILACSANNQAVTNIIDAFERVPERENCPLSGRWLPKISSLGVYHPAQSKAQEAASKGYCTPAQIEALEMDREYQDEARRHFRERAARYLNQPVPSIKDAASALHAQLSLRADRLRAVESARDEQQQAIAAQNAAFPGPDTIAEQIAREKKRAEAGARDLQEARAALEVIQDFFASESIVASLLGWVPAVRHRRAARLRAAMRQFAWTEKVSLDEPADFRRLEQAVQARVNESCEKADAAQHLATLANTLHARIVRTTDTLRRAITACLGHTPESLDLESVDIALDTTLRYEMFRLAVHYWEARWLLECANLSTDGEWRSRSGQERRARRWAKIAPCNVATFFMAPGLFSHKPGDGRRVPAYELADLLIVDEAGQVPPEVGAATFALAKHALVVGDIWQIEPVWSAQEPADNGNLVECGLVAGKLTDDQRVKIHQSGMTASAGSVMKLAQNASRYHYAPDLERGMYLFEHRRCADTIIEYCNALCYHGALMAKRGNPDGTLFPPLGFMDIPGQCTSASGSRVNRLEAEAIVSWIAAEAEAMRRHYGESIEKIIGVVTPFSAQAGLIRRALRERSRSIPGLERITVGTVHALQGAERPVVIFSPTYDGRANSGTLFFDRGPNMLNVAVSRAKVSFSEDGRTKHQKSIALCR